MDLLTIVEKLNAALERKRWQKTLITTYPTKEAFNAAIEKRLSGSTQAQCDAARQGFLAGQTEGYSKGYAEGAAEQLQQAKAVFREEYERDMCDKRLRRFIQ